mmetsp:Transcript_4308/g.3864  ORF Transcript_4308/g.3864 Transcript_4308/m.3864 type:complete len:245 (-) Transcript_4308:49-783(-)|eukprot:CAMPEP_0196763860 /NCGR_PEP_ID=MMETSP1095-20130614/4882_1 /TAXON_ID=96789 ORGANISM="Chromulina nebulosa, Strain UTEXLB2642" /NCGR_SAMPLE_ID=MMETSP1095 /ASSEMBLY_ACC=CAM_ASM_000446 /LENGTH=244 /DNA_ID=CAMNT_0042117971 /DNA_START=42 /DNA_END=776 /DNA_ORIENTATION=-
MSQGNFDRQITIFSPQGHLYQIEYAIKAALSGGNTAVAVRGANSAVFITQKKVPDRLVDPSSISSIYRITDSIGCLMLGLIPDIQSQIQTIRQEANQFKFDNGFPMPVHSLAKRYADLCQVATQEASYRAMACVGLFIGYDDEKNAQVFKVDPAGHYLPYKAVATGKLEAEAMNFLEKKVNDLSTLTNNETIELAISTMQYILSTDFKSNEIEIGVISSTNKFYTLTSEEIEERLVAITEKADN